MIFITYDKAHRSAYREDSKDTAGPAVKG